MRPISLRSPVAALVVVAALTSPVLAETGGSIEAAAKAFEEGRLAECVTLCEAIPDASKEHRKALFLRAESKLRLGEPADAQAGFEAVLAENDKSLPALIGFGRSLDAQGKHAEAEEALRAAVKQDKKSAFAHRALGETLIAQEKFSDARTALAKAWKLDGRDPLTAIALVDVHLGYKDAKGALKVARKLAKTRPDHPVGHFLVGRALEHDGEWKDAITAYEKALVCDDGYIDAHKNLGIVCQTQNSMYRDRDLLDKSMKHYARYFELGGTEPGLRQIYDQMIAFLKWQEEQGGK